jgi:hypothetical protein
MRQPWAAARAATVINPAIPIPITRHCGLDVVMGSADTRPAYLPVVPETIFAQRLSNSLAIASRSLLSHTPKIALGLR